MISMLEMEFLRCPINRGASKILLCFMGALSWLHFPKQILFCSVP